jgi:hypothetical protein
MDLDDKVADAERKRAEEILARIPPFAPCGDRIQEARKRLEATVARSPRPVGLLLKDPGGNWRVRSSP